MLRRVSLGFLLLLAVAACERVEPPPPAPPADFLLAAGDSVYWIRSEPDGIRVRGAPMSLAMVGGRLAELYVTEDDLSFYDAVYVGQRLFKRDLINGDSLQLYADTLMRLMARTYAAANPDEQPLALNEQGSENPRTIGSAEILVLDVLGPWVSFEYRTDVDVVGRPSSHGLRRGVLDLRTGVQVTLDALVGRREARAVVAEGQRQWREMRDSVLAASEAMADAERLREEFSRLGFDARSFGLGVLDRRPMVRFTVVQSGALHPAPPMTLFPIPLDSTPPWWAAQEEEYAVRGEQDELLWRRPEYEIVGRPDNTAGARVSLAMRDAGGQEWRLGFVPAPVRRVMWLEDSLLAPGTREALTRAFDEAALYGDPSRVARGAGRRAGSPQLLPVAHSSSSSVPRRHPPRRARTRE